MSRRGRLAIDRGLTALFDRYLHQIILLFLLAGSAVMRVKMAPETALSPDYSYILEWSAAYRDLGFIEGMGKVIGDYYVPFNVIYAITGLSPWEPWVVPAVFSCVCDYLLAAAVYLLICDLLLEQNDAQAKRKAAYMAVLTLYLPFVFMNSALWKQCDVFYVAFALLAVRFLLKDRFAAAFILLGISFSFKLQAVFFLPFFCLMYLLKKKFSILQFFWIPAVYLLAGLPAVWCGRGLRATYGVYFLQMMEGTASGTDSTPEDYGMVSFYPNFYNFGLDDFYETLALPAVLMTMMILLLSVVLAIEKKENLTKGKLLWLLAWQIWACNMFLPSMHERYDYGAVLIFSLLLPLLPRETLIPAAVLNIGTFVSYVRAMHVYPVSMDLQTVVYAAAFLWSTWVLVRRLLLRRGIYCDTTAKSP